MIHKLINFDLSFGSTPSFFYPSIADCHLGMLSSRYAEAQALSALKESEQSLLPVQGSTLQVRGSVEDVLVSGNSSLIDSRSSMLATGFATDAANAAKAAASATNLVVNMRAFRFLIITQCGLGPDSIEKIFNFEQRFGDPKVAGLV
jgi:hypothetical protein